MPDASAHRARCPARRAAPSGGGRALSSASLSIEANLFGFTTSFAFPATSATGRAGSALSATVGAGSAFRGTQYHYLPLASFTYALFRLEGNGPGSFAGATRSEVGGRMPFTGATPNSVGGPMLITGAAYLSGLAKLVLPLVIGAPASRFHTDFTKKGGVGLALTGQGASWTVGTAKHTISGMTVSTIAGANLLTPAGGGTLVLVSPTRVLGSVPLNSFSFVFSTRSFLTLTFAPVPEPGTLLLLASGVVALAALGRRRGRSEGPRASSHPSE